MQLMPISDAPGRVTDALKSSWLCEMRGYHCGPDTPFG